MIILFTDFGSDGPYTGQVKVVLAQHTAVEVIDLCSDLPPSNIKAAAYLLPAYTQCMHKNSICLSVIDPGVGGERRAIAVNADDRWYVGPDNGLLSIVVRNASQVNAWNIPVPGNLAGTSFHGRDLFAPIAAEIANGLSIPGEEIDLDSIVDPGWPDDLSEIIYIDRYGNAITGIRARSLSSGSVLRIKGLSIKYAKSFSHVSEGGYLWYENSNGLVELSANCASIADQLSLDIGDEIIIAQDA